MRYKIYIHVYTNIYAYTHIYDNVKPKKRKFMMSFFHIYSQVYMNQRDYGISLKAVAYSKNIPIPAWELRGKKQHDAALF